MEIKRIKEFDFLRDLACIMIFVNHIWAFLSYSIPDFGSRAVELFFLLSGFLMFHNYKNKTIDTSIKDCFKFGVKKITPYYLLHIITLLLLLYYHINEEGFLYLKTNLLSIIANITLLQSWIPIEKIYWGGNGVSWFLSSILFCYILFPIIKEYVNRIKIEKEIVLFAIIIVITYVQSIYTGRDHYTYGYVFHIFPFYGLGLFFLGTILSSLFDKNYNDEHYLPINSDFIILIVIGFYVLSIFLFSNKWDKYIYRSIFNIYTCTYS